MCRREQTLATCLFGATAAIAMSQNGGGTFAVCVCVYCVRVRGCQQAREHFLERQRKTRAAAEKRFRALDADGSGSLSLEEAMAGAKILDLTEEQAKEWFIELDTDGGGDVDIDEFLARCARSTQTRSFGRAAQVIALLSRTRHQAHTPPDKRARAYPQSPLVWRREVCSGGDAPVECERESMSEREREKKRKKKTRTRSHTQMSDEEIEREHECERGNYKNRRLVLVFVDLFLVSVPAAYVCQPRRRRRLQGTESSAKRLADTKAVQSRARAKSPGAAASEAFKKRMAAQKGTSSFSRTARHSLHGTTENI